MALSLFLRLDYSPDSLQILVVPIAVPETECSETP